MLWILLILVFFVWAYFRFTRNFDYWKKRNVVYEPPVPIFGNFLRTALHLEGIGSIIKRLYNKYDTPYFGMFFFCSPFLVVRSRELLKQIMVSNFSSFPNRQTYAEEFIDPWSTNTLIHLRNEEWKSLRNKLAPIFTSGKMKLMMNLMKQCSDQLETYLERNDGEEVEVRELAKRYFIEVICVCVFGIKPNNVNADRSYIRECACKLLNTETYKWIFSLIMYFLCPFLVKLCNLQFLDRPSAKYLVNIFENSYKKRRETQIQTHDLIDLLLNLQQQEKEDDAFKFNDVKLSSQALVFFHAGNEPSAGILSFCLYELALNKPIQDTLRKEIMENLDSDGCFSYDTMMSMPYLDMVLKETLRKYPLVQFLLRMAEKDHVFEGFTIEKGTNIYISMSALHHDPQYYPNPEKFDPERFRGNKPKDYETVFLAFGDGPRKCMGYRFAMMSMKLALAVWIRDFDVSVCENTENPIKMKKTAFLMAPASNKLYLKINRIRNC